MALLVWSLSENLQPLSATSLGWPSKCLMTSSLDNAFLGDAWTGSPANTEVGTPLLPEKPTTTIVNHVILCYLYLIKSTNSSIKQQPSEPIYGHGSEQFGVLGSGWSPSPASQSQGSTWCSWAPEIHKVPRSFWGSSDGIPMYPIKNLLMF